MMSGFSLCKDNRLHSKTIRIENLSVGFFSGHQKITALDAVSVEFKENQITGVIGETGSGKSLLGLSLVQLLPGNADIKGHIHYQGQDILSFTGSRLQSLRGDEIALIPQNPGTSLNPIMSIKKQICEAMDRQGKMGKSRKDEYINELLQTLRLNQSAIHGATYPFELSGGMKQRVLTAIGICRRPAWILADEPTSGLDACLRSEICTLFKHLHSTTGSGMILITHDLFLAKNLCHDIVVMYCGKVVETAPVGVFYSDPAHPYSKALLRSLPQGGFTPIPGENPSIANPPAGCRFHPRCCHKQAICRVQDPPSFSTGVGRKARCHLYA